ncbi:non-specific lipid-transfer protein 1-like isoform X2 [Canna indica]|uniref:Non-specific lipid-transfer protein n=1 Tax=Canna indica TaxID=4628 RepID=A0AAQ3QMY8_9LILI|nr:non-specific lipid-transfer protein 1-like isoform X2 [Canna indica]
MARSGALVVLVLAVALLASSLRPCISYVTGKGPLAAARCSGVRSLKSAAATPADRRTACSCIKPTVAGVRGVKPGLASGLPGKCGVSIPYPISSSTDCSNW